jgi:hypothetical protein
MAGRSELFSKAQFRVKTSPSWMREGTAVKPPKAVERPRAFWTAAQHDGRER